MIKWYLGFPRKNLRLQFAANRGSRTKKGQESQCLFTLQYLESTGTSRENYILWSWLLSPTLSPHPPLNPMPSHLHIFPSPPSLLAPSIQSKPQSALAWIKELPGIPSVSILSMCPWECVKRAHICLLPGCNGRGGALVKRTVFYSFHSKRAFMPMCASIINNFWPQLHQHANMQQRWVIVLSKYRLTHPFCSRIRVHTDLLRLSLLPHAGLPKSTVECFTAVTVSR